MTEPSEAETPLSEIRLDHAMVEDSHELDIVAAEIALYLRRSEFAAVKAFFVVQEIPDIASLLEHMEPEDALRSTNAKFVRRFQFIEAELAKRGKSADQSDLAEMDALWDAAKLAEKA